MSDQRLIERLRGETSAAMRRVRNMVRRMTVSLAEGTLWNLDGYQGETDGNVEQFPGIGFYARPVAGAVNVEAIVVRLGEDHPVIVATRDEDTRVELDTDETAIFTSSSVVKIKQDGTIEIGSRGGTFQPLATKADLQTVRDELNGHAHTYLPGTGSATLTTGNPSVTAPTGTTKLMGE